MGVHKQMFAIFRGSWYDGKNRERGPPHGRSAIEGQSENPQAHSRFGVG